jgi:putative inorganic carbon (HCO3(-)) transporter
MTKQRHAPSIALLQLVGVLICLPPLIFPDQLPAWLAPAAIAGLAVVFAAGRGLAGRAFVATPVDLPLLILLLLLPFNLWVSADAIRTLPHLYKVVGGTALFYAVVGFLRERPWFLLASLAIHLLGGALGVILLFGTQWSGQFGWLPVDPDVIPRLVNPFWKPEGFAGFNPNLAGGTLALVLPIPTAYALFGRRAWPRVAALVEAAVLAFLLLLISSRGAVVGFAAALIVMLVAHDRRWLALPLVLLLAAATLFATGRLAPLVDPLLAGDPASSVQGLDARLELWSRGRYILQDFPFTGVGMGMVEQVIRILYPTFLIPPDAEIKHVHNLYLEMGAELGYPGLIATVALLLLLFYLAWRSVGRARSTGLAPLATGLLGMLVALAIHGLLDVVPYAPKAYLIIRALFAVTVALALHLRDQAQPSISAPNANARSGSRIRPPNARSGSRIRVERETAPGDGGWEQGRDGGWEQGRDGGWEHGGEAGATPAEQ